MSESLFFRIKSLLDENNIAYTHLTHPRVHRSVEAAKIRGTRLEQAAKALVLQDSDGVVYMFVVGGDRRLDLKTIKKRVLNVKNVSLAHPDVVLEKTGCTIGSVPPFGNLLGLKVFVDKYFVESQDEIVFSAGTHFDSIKMRLSDYLSIVNPVIADFSVPAD